ncbi:hypothetical protein ACOBR2_05280 [Telmatobacter bradus]|uniref:hypothetical protein n=1 Tax=Telmatobacter bradus TaxID=474953 RepID=UPI003B42E035
MNGLKQIKCQTCRRSAKKGIELKTKELIAFCAILKGTYPYNFAQIAENDGAASALSVLHPTPDQIPELCSKTSHPIAYVTITDKTKYLKTDPVQHKRCYLRNSQICARVFIHYCWLHKFSPSR